MKFLADENVSHVVIVLLRESGFEVETIPFDRRGRPDEAVLELARSDQRIVITEDRDFGLLVIRKGLPVLGILLLELDELSNAGEAQRVLDVLKTHAAKLEGNLIVVEPGRIRIRPLPGATGS